MTISTSLSQNYSDADHARKYRQLKPAADRQSAETDADFDVLMKQGFVIIERLLSEEQCEAIKAEGLGLLGYTGRNAFEEHKTQRVYNVLAKTEMADELATHPRILGLLDKLFRPGFLLSQSQIINIQPGENAQGLHFDESFYRIPRPRAPLGAATVWAIDAFTSDNGATVVIPESHHWDDDRIGTREEAIPAAMPQGSVIFFLGTTWHGGGQNQSNCARFAITHQYCDAYMRQQENYLLELSKERVREMSPELQSLVGYNIYPPFMGMVDGMHPLRTLERV